MSNWSSVILCWSGTDQAVKDADVRIREIESRCESFELGLRPPSRMVSYPCGEENDRSIGDACETVVLYHWNHFSPDELLAALRQLPWGMPEQVEFFWKDEQIDSYRRVGLLDAKAKMDVTETMRRAMENVTWREPLHPKDWRGPQPAPQAIRILVSDTCPECGGDGGKARFDAAPDNTCVRGCICLGSGRVQREVSVEEFCKMAGLEVKER